jgi:hypothetical protein
MLFKIPTTPKSTKRLRSLLFSNDNIIESIIEFLIKKFEVFL